MKRILILLSLILFTSLVKSQSYNMVIRMNEGITGNSNNIITIPINNIYEITIQEDCEFASFLKESFKLSVTEIISKMMEFKYSVVSAKSDVITFKNNDEDPTTISFYYENNTMIGIYAYENIIANNRIQHFFEWDNRMNCLAPDFNKWAGMNVDLNMEYTNHSTFIRSINNNTTIAYETMSNSTHEMSVRADNDSISFQIHLLGYKYANNGFIPVEPDIPIYKPETELFFQGQKLFYDGQGNAANGLAWPKHTDDGWESALFFIRADGMIPDFYDKSSSLYYGRQAEKAGVTNRNIGKVSNLYNYPHYNDRNLDYYQINYRTGNNIGLFRYVYDQSGLKTQPVILEAPSIVAILADEVDDLEAEIADNRNVAKNTVTLANVNALLAKGENYLNSHVLWYVVKEVGGQYRWHVNGVIRDNETPMYVIDPIPDNVEVDIHQQEYKDWNKIKTTIHVRTDVESVKVNIPLKEEDILERDDFNIRIFDFYYKEYVVKHTITHDANGITIEIRDIHSKLISLLKDNFGDGLTIEINSFSKKDVWDELKNSYVQTGKPCIVEGHVSSATNGLIKPIYIISQ